MFCTIQYIWYTHWQKGTIKKTAGQDRTENDFSSTPTLPPGQKTDKKYKWEWKLGIVTTYADRLLSWPLCGSLWRLYSQSSLTPLGEAAPSGRASLIQQYGLRRPRSLARNVIDINCLSSPRRIQEEREREGLGLVYRSADQDKLGSIAWENMEWSVLFREEKLLVKLKWFIFLYYYSNRKII